MMDMQNFNPRQAGTDKDKDLDGIIRPQDLKDFSGQEKIIENLKVYVAAAKM